MNLLYVLQHVHARVLHAGNETAQAALSRQVV